MKKKFDFTNREIETFLEEVRTKLDEIKEQTTRTNGRLSALERWRSFITGGLAILAMLFIPVFLKFLGM